MIDLLVIGAGPTGLFMAAEAARHGLTCRIIDKSPSPSDKSKALAIQPRTLEIFDHLGIVDRFLSKGVKIRAVNPTSERQSLAHLSFVSLHSPFPFVLSLEQSETEKILADYLASFGLKVEREVEFLNLLQTEDCVQVTLLNRGKEERVRTQWLTGCDGAHSAVRKALNLSFSGRAIPTIFSLVDVQIDWKYPHDELFLFLNPGGILGAIPMPGKNRYRLVFQSKEGIDLLNEAEEKLREYADRKASLSHPLWTANFHIHSRLVKSYQKGRVFLAGDAAHIHSPAGGQGMNSGLQDAFNLVWKFKQPHLLPTYTLERRSWGKNLLRATRLATWAASLRNPLAIALRNWAIATFAPHLAERLTSTIAQLTIRYPKSPIAYESGCFSGGPHAGMRASNIPLFIKGTKTDLFSLLRKTTRPHLLLFSSENISLVPEALPLFIQKGTTDPDGTAHAIYGIKKPSAYLIRPDLYIAFRKTL